MFNFPKGSEWRKWDLHMHSTASDGKATPADIIDEAKVKGLSVIALTDHHSVSNIDEIKLLGKEAGIKVISGIEFRTEYGAKSVHMIGLFPDQYNDIELNQQALCELILAPLNLSKTQIVAEGKRLNSALDDDAAFKQGIFHVQVDFKTAADLVHKYGGIVSVHAGNKSNAIEEMKHEGKGATNVDLLEDSLGPVKEDLLRNYVDICEVQKCSEATFYLKTFGRPSIATSDAHEKNVVGKKFTWIKADPTFDGLLQIKFEPEQRVCIQEEKPGNKANYSVIDYVTINNPDFSTDEKETTIPFNPDLTCIIGGKSTGKSLLLNNIAYAIDREQVVEKYPSTRPESRKKNNGTVFLPVEGVTVHWADGYESSSTVPISKKIVYIPQTYLNRLSDEKEETTEIDTIIEEILLQDEDIKSKHAKFETSTGKLKVETDRLLYDYLQLCGKISTLKKELLENNNSAFITKEIEKIELERKKYISETEITEEQSQKYNSLCDEFQRKQKDRVSLLHDKEIIDEVTEIQIQFPVEFTELQSDIRDKASGIIRNLENQANATWVENKEALLKEITASIEACEKRTEELKKEIDDLRPIMERNANLISLSDKLSKEKAKLDDALKFESEIEMQESKSIGWLDELVKKFFSYKKLSEEYVTFVNETKSASVDGLHFTVETVLRCDAIRTRLLEVLNNKTISRFKKVDITQLTENLLTDEVLKEIVLSLQADSQDTLNLKSQYTLSTFLGELFSNWYNTNYVVKMDEDDFEKMSPGKKALVLLKLLIGLANSDCPMLIDQPEDDLDNRSIFDDLVKYIKEKKTERQIIIVTHNANIVVGADSDEIIVANQNGQNTPNEKTKFEYVSGSIENSFKIADEKIVLKSQGIKEHICEVLEGGERAFTKRKNKYRMGT